MKKFIVLTLIGLLILVFSATVHAQQLEFKASGYYSVTTYWFRNITAGQLLTKISPPFSRAPSSRRAGQLWPLTLARGIARKPFWNPGWPSTSTR